MIEKWIRTDIQDDHLKEKIAAQVAQIRAAILAKPQATPQPQSPAEARLLRSIEQGERINQTAEKLLAELKRMQEPEQAPARPIDPEKWYNSHEIAAMFGISHDTAARRMRDWRGVKDIGTKERGRKRPKAKLIIQGKNLRLAIERMGV